MPASHGDVPAISLTEGHEQREVEHRRSIAGVAVRLEPVMRAVVVGDCGDAVALVHGAILQQQRLM